MEIVDDGEISSVPAPRLPASSGQESLKPIYSYRSSATAKGFDDSDKDSSGNDSDDENCHIRPAKRFCSPLDKIRSPVVMTQAPYPSIAEEVSDSNKPTKKKRKPNNIWANVVGEQTLTETIETVGLKKLTGDRSVENYDFEAVQEMRRREEEEAYEEEAYEEEEADYEQPPPIEEEHMEEVSNVKARLSRKRPKPDSRPWREPEAGEELSLPPLPSLDGMTDEQVGELIADRLHERKPEIVVNVVKIMGREVALSLYNDTREIESQGGLMIVNQARRRTSGGVFLFKLKGQHPTREQQQAIFPPDLDRIALRKKQKAHRRYKDREAQKARSAFPLPACAEKEEGEADFPEAACAEKEEGEDSEDEGPTAPTVTPLGSSDEEVPQGDLINGTLAAEEMEN